ncbi:MAG: hypothetical protein ABIT58_00480, partial [Ferruginibacter sp.]
MDLFTKKPSRTSSQSLFFFFLIFSISSYAGNVVPDMPGPVSGQVNVCALVGTERTATYTIIPVAGA